MWVDHTAPDPVLVRVGPEGVDGPLTEGALIRGDYFDDQVELCPDYNGQITFQAAATDVDDDHEIMAGLQLQFLDDVTTASVGNPTWRDIDLDWEFRDAPGNDNNPDGKWVAVAPSLQYLAMEMEDAVAGEELPAKEYRFRVLGVDYACNTNEDSEGRTPALGSLRARRLVRVRRQQPL